jgi:hypothetical protein
MLRCVKRIVPCGHHLKSAAGTRHNQAMYGVPGLPIPAAVLDQPKVTGLVASLIFLDAEYYNKSTALEITAGGKLYNIIDDYERAVFDMNDGDHTIHWPCTMCTII